MFHDEGDVLVDALVGVVPLQVGQALHEDEHVVDTNTWEDVIYDFSLRQSRQVYGSSELLTIHCETKARGSALRNPFWSNMKAKETI